MGLTKKTLHQLRSFHTAKRGAKRRKAFEGGPDRETGVRVLFLTNLLRSKLHRTREWDALSHVLQPNFVTVEFKDYVSAPYICFMNGALYFPPYSLQSPVGKFASLRSTSPRRCAKLTLLNYSSAALHKITPDQINSGARGGDSKMPSNEMHLPPGLRWPERRVIANVIVKDRVTTEKYSIETNGEYSRFRCEVKAGGGVPLHFHHSYAEHFVVKSGELGVVLGDEVIHLKPGEGAKVPMGTKHRFFNDSDSDTEFVVELRPGQEGFEKSAYIWYGLANDGFCNQEGIPKSLVQTCLLTDMGDMSLPGWIGWGASLLNRAVAMYARWSGVEEELLQRYWYS